MNPGLVIKLRPTGPWRIGPDSGARNRVDAIYHSDSLYSAVTSVIARLGSLEEWLDATARQSAPAVCFSSCFPFLDEIGFVVPPRTVWPPTSPGLMSARVRWKSARFVPLGIVQAILAGQRLDPNHWSVDGASECLVPAGRPGPFRTGIRWNAAVDRLTGATDRHSTACIEFRPGAGLWTIVSFADDAARDRWLEPVKGAFRLLADSGFGGERSRGWGRSEAPEFIEGSLPEMIVPKPGAQESAPEVKAPVSTAPPEPESTEPESTEPAQAGASEAELETRVSDAPPETSEPLEGTAEVRGPADIAPLAAPTPELPPDPEAEPPSGDSLNTTPEPRHGEPVPPTPEPEAAPTSEAPEGPAAEAESQTGRPEASPSDSPEATVSESVPPTPEPEAVPSPEVAAAEPAPPAGESEAAPSSEPEVAATEAVSPTLEPEAVPSSGAPEVAAAEPASPVGEPEAAPSNEPEVAATEAAPRVGESEAGSAEPPSSEAPAVPESTPSVTETGSPAAEPEPTPSTVTPEAMAEAAPTPLGATSAFWVLSLYTPAPDDAVDWQRGNYTVLVRGGRVDSSGDLKKQLQMVAEGSVLAAVSEPRGAATDVAPDGFAHPVFRAGFAVCIPLPEVS